MLTRYLIFDDDSVGSGKRSWRCFTKLFVFQPEKPRLITSSRRMQSDKEVSTRPTLRMSMGRKSYKSEALLEMRSHPGDPQRIAAVSRQAGRLEGREPVAE